MDKKINSQNGSRGEQGMSLATTLILGVVLSTFAAALLNAVLPGYNKVSALRNQQSLRSMTEAGMDYTIQTLNSNQATTSVTVPSTLLTVPGATVNVNIATVADPPKSSMLYDPLFDIGPNANTWKLVTVTAQVGAARKQMRCLLQPLTQAPSNFQYGLFGVASIVYAGQAGFNTYNRTRTIGGKNVQDQRDGAAGGSLGKISQVYGNGGLTRSIVQGGNHYEYPNPASYYNQVFNISKNIFNATTASTAPWMQMMGNVYSNGSNTAYYPSSPTTYDSSANVFGMWNGIDSYIPNGTSSGGTPNNIPVGSPASWSGGLTAWNVQPSPSLSNTTYPQPPVPSAPDAPTGTTNLGSISLSNGASLIIQEGAPAPTSQLSSLSGSSKSVTIPPGNYQVNSVSLSGGSKITVSSGTTSNTSLYVVGNNSTAVTVSNDSSINMTGISGTGINFTGSNGLKNGSQNGAASNQIAINDPTKTTLTNNIAETGGSASQLQLFTNANTNMVFSGNERMLIYAPYANITIGSTLTNSQPDPLNSKDANFYGAACGQNIYVESDYDQGYGAFVHYDWNLHDATKPANIDPWSKQAPFSNGTISGYRAVTWQEAVQAGTDNAGTGAQWFYQ